MVLVLISLPSEIPNLFNKESSVERRHHGLATLEEGFGDDNR